MKLVSFSAAGRKVRPGALLEEANLVVDLGDAGPVDPDVPGQPEDVVVFERLVVSRAGFGEPVFGMPRYATTERSRTRNTIFSRVQSGSSSFPTLRASSGTPRS